MKKVVTIAVRHPELPNLFLHGLRRDNHKWALAGGHAKLGEIDQEAASRELEEETGLKGVKLEHMHENTYGDTYVHLFSCGMPDGAKLNPNADPDSEFVTFKFLDPTTHDNLHIPKERNILSEWITNSLKKPESTVKASPKIKVEPFIADPSMFNPRKHDFIVKAFSRGKQVGMLAVTHTPAGGLMPFNFEVKKLHRRKGIGTAMAAHAQKISGKKIVRSPDMTQDAVHWANSFIKPAPMVKAEVEHNEETATLMNRVEDKYFLPKDKLEWLIGKLKEHLPDGDPDTSVRFNVNKTVYLDNRDLDAMRDNMDDRKPRFKVRIRQYSPNGEEWEDVAYVELKIKVKDGESKKIRIRIPATEMPAIEAGKPIRVDEQLEKLNLDITKDILWRRIATINTVIDKYGFRKQIVVTYQRRAFSDSKLRITIDDGLRYTEAKMVNPDILMMVKTSSAWKQFKKRHLKIRKDDFLVLEVKHEEGTPGWVKDLLDKANAKSVRYSKYCGAMVSYLTSEGKSDGDITYGRKIDAESVLSDVKGYDVIGKAEQAPPQNDLVLSYPVTIAGKRYGEDGIPFSMTIKNFGPIDESQHADLDQVISSHDASVPIDPAKLMFVIHEIAGLGGRKHVLSIHGLPGKIAHLMAATSPLGPSSSSNDPHIEIDEGTYHRLNKLGRALTSDEADITIHPLELRSGGTVLKTY